MSLDELRSEWRRLYEKDPPRISRELLVLGIGYGKIIDGVNLPHAHSVSARLGLYSLTASLCLISVVGQIGLMPA